MVTTQPSDWAVDPVTKLAPCPFCGSKAHIDRESDMDGFGTFYCVQCEKCRARSGQKYVSTGNDCPLFYAEVRDEWNNRTPNPPHPSADAVREYVTELRAQADQKMGVAGACAHDGDRARYKSAAQLLRRVADELESLISAASGEGVDDTKRLDWIARQGGYEFDFGILNDQPGDGDWFVHGMGGSGQGATFRDAIDAAIKEEAGGQDANTDILDTLAFKTENGDAGRGSVTYIALVASGEADHQQNAAQGGGEK